LRCRARVLTRVRVFSNARPAAPNRYRPHGRAWRRRASASRSQRAAENT